MIAAVLSLLFFLTTIGTSLAAPPRAEAQDRHLYNRVMEEFQREDYEAALAGFLFFIKLHGDSGLAGSAQYWIGECEFRLGRYQKALAAFEVVRVRYPQSPKLPAAILKSALSHAKLGEAHASKTLLQRVLVEFAGTPEAKLARQALKSPDLLPTSTSVN